MRSYRYRRVQRHGKNDGSLWLSFSDLMSSLLLIIILVLFYVMYQYFDMYEVNMAEIARRQYDLDLANASLEEQQTQLDEQAATLDEQATKLTAQEKQIIKQKQELETAQADLETAQELLETQKADLETAQADLKTAQEELKTSQTELETSQAELETSQAELETSQAELETAQADLKTAQEQLTAQQQDLSSAQATVEEKETEIATQQEKLDALSAQLTTQAEQINAQQEKLDDQQAQIEQLVCLKTKIIASLSEALKEADVSATVDPTNGSIALESDVLFATGQYVLTEEGKRRIDDFLPVYLDVLFSDEYRPYIAEIIIEGHTDSRGPYINNLLLSQQRAAAVANYVLSDSYTGISREHRDFMRTVATANGRSYSDPVLVNGVEDMDASRRVVFKFRLTDENMIEQLKEILEDRPETTPIEIVVEPEE